MKTTTFKPSHDISETVQLFIGLSLVEFHKSINLDSLLDELDESLVREIMQVMDIQSEFFLRAFRAATYLKLALNIVHQDELRKVMEATEDELDTFAKIQFSKELDNIFESRSTKTLQLIEFFRPPLWYSKIRVQKKFITLLAHI